MSKNRLNSKTAPKELPHNQLSFNNIPDASPEESEEILSEISILSEEDLIISSSTHFTVFK